MGALTLTAERAHRFTPKLFLAFRLAESILI
jgi:hypothetical protein